MDYAYEEDWNEKPSAEAILRDLKAKDCRLRDRLASMGKVERSLLLYFETCAVDCGGRVNLARMNDDDHKVLKIWIDTGFVTYGRICMGDHNRDGTMWVLLSMEAFELAHMERRARAVRMWQNRVYQTTAEKRGEEVPEPRG